jgi:hypothetical protein
MKEEEPDSVPLRNWLKFDDEEVAIERLDIYAYAYFVRLVDILKEDFDQLAKCMDEDVFRAMVQLYLKTEPPGSSTLFDLGAALPTFLREHQHPDVPEWIADFALLERTLADVFMMPDADPLAPDALVSLPPEQWDVLCFEPVPALKWIEVAFPINKVWNRVRKDEPWDDIDMSPCPSRIVVWRKELFSRFHVLPPKEAEAFQLMLDGEPFGVICGAFLPADTPPEELPPEELQTCIQDAYMALSRWLQEGMLWSFRLDDEEAS